MAWLVLLLVVLTGGAAAPFRRLLATRRERAAAAQQTLRLSRRAAHEDVGVLADRLADLGRAPLTEAADGSAHDDLVTAARAHAQAREALREGDVATATRLLAEAGRVLAAGWSSGEDPAAAGWVTCFFNPRHGPTGTCHAWAPAGCTPQDVPTCRECWDRLEEGLQPEWRDVVRGNRHVPWFRGGPDYGPYAEGYYGAAAREGRFPPFVVVAMLQPSGTAPDAAPEGWEGWAGDDRSADIPDRPRRRLGGPKHRDHWGDGGGVAG